MHLFWYSLLYAGEVTNNVRMPALNNQVLAVSVAIIMGIVPASSQLSSM